MPSKQPTAAIFDPSHTLLCFLVPNGPAKDARSPWDVTGKGWIGGFLKDPLLVVLLEEADMVGRASGERTRDTRIQRAAVRGTLREQVPR